MTNPIYASAMLATAQRLAGVGAAPGRPALCDLRRATSTAYYALFHQLTRHGALVSVPSAEEDEISYLARWYSHTGIKRASRQVSMTASTGALPKEDRTAVALLRRSPARPVSPQLLTVAESFLELQAAREEADYSNDYEPLRYTTLDYVATAEVAVRTCWSLWRARSSSSDARIELHDGYARFLQLALLHSGGPRSR